MKMFSHTEVPAGGRVSGAYSKFLLAGAMLFAKATAAETSARKRSGPPERNVWRHAVRLPEASLKGIRAAEMKNPHVPAVVPGVPVLQGAFAFPTPLILRLPDMPGF